MRRWLWRRSRHDDALDRVQSEGRLPSSAMPTEPDSQGPVAAPIPDVPVPAPELVRAFEGLEKAGETEVVWGGGTIPIRVASYFCESFPTLEQVSSVRCIVFRGDAVLVVREGERGERAHVVPGGRREAGESVRQTLERELLEEIGWTVGEPRLIGVVWLRHGRPLPPDRPLDLRLDPRWYPDFVWLIYTAEAAEERPEAMIAGHPEGVPGFVPLAEVDALPLGDESRLFLSRASVVTGRKKWGQRPPLPYMSSRRSESPSGQGP